VPERHDQPDAAAVLALFHRVADLVGEHLAGVTEWGPSGARAGQYAVDLAVDDVCVPPLVAAGLAVLSEESGLHEAHRPVTVVVDPLDGSTNASHGVPWFGTSLCAVDAEGPWVAMVADQAGPRRWSAIRGEGALAEGSPLVPSNCLRLDDALLGLSGLPPRHLGWRQFRALGASALDLCLVAAGTLDGFVDCSADAHGVWDYAAGLLICAEAGAVVADAYGRDLIVLDPTTRRTPVAAGTPALLKQLLAVRRW
jgi:fructose-1,6-bisphosphatase/inositol monophosphatase family enzyme